MPHNKKQIVHQRALLLQAHDLGVGFNPAPGAPVMGRNHMDVNNHHMDQTMYFCSFPRGCPRLHSDPIHADDPEDAVKVYCNNEDCTAGTFMHADCFTEWEHHVLAYLRSCGRARSWSEKQRLQNLWTKKGYDLAYKACDCKCGRGHLRKDLDYIQPSKDDRKLKKNKHVHSKTATKQVPSTPVNQTTIVPSQQSPTSGMRPQLRVRTSSFSSTGSNGSTGSAGSPPSSAGTPPLKKFDFFDSATQAAAGNIFRRRTDFSVFNILPRNQQNPYHIKMEDEGPHGNDETRSFVLTNLSSHRITRVDCVVCQNSLPVFDKYPLIDGTFFLSPMRYNTDLQVVFDSRMQYLNALCMKCLEKPEFLRCVACKVSWYGGAFIIGSMYAYDIFAAIPCCASRLSCKNCHQGILDPSCAFSFFSEYSKPFQCPHCKVEDYHFVKPIQEIYTPSKRPIWAK